MPEQSSPRRTLEIVLPWVTIFKVLAAGLLTYLAVELWPLLSLLLLALLIAITLFPILHWTRHRRWPDWVGILLIALLLFVSVGLFAGILIPTIASEGAEIIKKLPSFEQEAVARLPTLACSPKVDPGAMRVGGARAPPKLSP